MKVGELINYLTKYYEPDDCIVVAWWDQSHFEEAEHINNAEWEACCEAMERMDWSMTFEKLEVELSECLEQMEDE